MQDQFSFWLLSGLEDVLWWMSESFTFDVNCSTTFTHTHKRCACGRSTSFRWCTEFRCVVGSPSHERPFTVIFALATVSSLVSCFFERGASAQGGRWVRSFDRSYSTYFAADRWRMCYHVSACSLVAAPGQTSGVGWGGTNPRRKGGVRVCAPASKSAYRLLAWSALKFGGKHKCGHALDKEAVGGSIE